jgi:catechol 2,3-dioxygenase-like lactoylglutathione lyase family enzyme
MTGCVCERFFTMVVRLFAIFALVAAQVPFAEAFLVSTNNPAPLLHQRCTSAVYSHIADTAVDDDDKHPMAATSRLSHVMLRVPSVDKTVEYWKEKGGRVKIAKAKPGTSNGGTELMSAFLELGCTSSSRDDDDDDKESGPMCFALELVATNKENYSIGNVISHIGVSMLLQFQNNLLGLITGDEQIKPQGEEPNGIPVQSAASAPGDFLSRFALNSNDLASTLDFYTSVLGMEAKAQDDNMLCLRYDNACFAAGVPTTLVFENAPTENNNLDMGNCFDHLVIATKTDIHDIYEQSQDRKVFMKPTEMFGKTVMGLIDPNGYKVIIAQ